MYARKSTDVEDKQVLSIEAQLTELRAFAKEHGVDIVDELIEKQSAKVPGRPIFNAMLDRIEKGEASGIVSWHPDRLARNSVDGGKIIYFLDIGHLASLKFPSHWFENTPQGKFTLSMAFVQSKYYVDSLAENTKRGLRQKVRRGEFPGPAPIGYLNDVRTKTVIVEKKKSVIIRRAFELYAKNKSRLEDVATFLAKSGIVTKSGKRISKDRVSVILSNPFYYGHFRYAGEVYEGKHQPVVAKKLFDEVQRVLEKRGKQRKSDKNSPQAFCGLLRCATCHMMITGEYKVKKQKNGNVHYYTYYRCTKKSKVVNCTEPCIRQEQLDCQLSSLLKTVSLRPDWAKEWKVMLADDERKFAQSVHAFVEEKREKIKVLNGKLQRLLDSYLEQDIERDVYIEKKAKLMSDKKSLEEQIISLPQKQTGWLEPMRKWIGEAETLGKIASDTDLFEKKVVAEKVFGSNLLLGEKTVRACALQSIGNSAQNAYAALSAAYADFGKLPESQIRVRGKGLEPLASSTSPRIWRGKMTALLHLARNGRGKLS